MLLLPCTQNSARHSQPWTWTWDAAQVKAPSDARILKIRDYEDKLVTINSSVKVRLGTALLARVGWCLAGHRYLSAGVSGAARNLTLTLNTLPNALQEDRKLGAAAAWENKTDSRIQEKQVQQRFAALKAQADSALASRQDKLAQKLHEEEQALKQELISCQETPAQRRAQMAARAHELARRREAERQQLAAALMDQAFRDNCDPLRERNSKRLVYKTVQEREQQVRCAAQSYHRLICPGCHQFPGFKGADAQCDTGRINCSHISSVFGTNAAGAREVGAQSPARGGAAHV